MVELSVNRLSEQADIIPLMVSERLVDVHKDYRALPWKPLDSSVPITVTKAPKTV